MEPKVNDNWLNRLRYWLYRARFRNRVPAGQLLSYELFRQLLWLLRR